MDVFGGGNDYYSYNYYPRLIGVIPATEESSSITLVVNVMLLIVSLLVVLF